MRLASTVAKLALLVFAFGCSERRREQPAPAQPAPPAPSANQAPWTQALAALPNLPPVRTEPLVPQALECAREEFEVLTDGNMGTAKMYSRAYFFPLDDQRARSEGEFLGRLRAVFGERPEDEYVLRHRATGLIVTA